MLLAGALLFATVGALLLSLGAADPPRTGAQRDTIPQSTLSRQPRHTLLLPAPPFTIETNAIFAAGAVWLFDLNTSDQSIFRLELYGDGTYTLRAPVEALRVGFPHLRGAGERMRVRVDVAINSETTLRLNNEIAWRGVPNVPAGARLTASSMFQKEGMGITNTGWEMFTVFAPD